jgi:hypothetical protein
MVKLRKINKMKIEKMFSINEIIRIYSGTE